MRQAGEIFRRAFPDWRSDVQQLIAGGDLVAENFIARGTHLGAVMGETPPDARSSSAASTSSASPTGRSSNDGAASTNSACSTSSGSRHRHPPPRRDPDPIGPAGVLRMIAAQHASRRWRHKAQLAETTAETIFRWMLSDVPSSACVSVSYDRLHGSAGSDLNGRCPCGRLAPRCPHGRGFWRSQDPARRPVPSRSIAAHTGISAGRPGRPCKISVTASA